MRLATVEQAQQIDQISQSAYKLTSEVLMEAAGALAAREIDLSFLPELTRGSVAIVCGPGHNGGDGLVVARHLHSIGHRDLDVLLSPHEQKSPLFNLERERLLAQGLRVVDLGTHPEGLEILKRASLIVDALFGIGLTRPIRDPEAKLVEAMNASRAAKVALDCPSGLNANNGRVEGLAVRANMTITFGLAKPGFFVSEGPLHVGKLRILPIGFPYEALRGISTSHFLFTEKLARRYLPKRKDTANKSDHGRVLILAGRSGFWGAGILSSSAAFRVGAGYVIWASHESPTEALKDIPEVLTAAVGEELLWRSSYQAIAIGPGLGTGEETAKLIERLKELKDVPVVVDADAITAAIEFNLFPFPKHWVITPHAGEMGRILNMQAPDIERDRFRAVLLACEKTNCHVLLKGFRSLLARDKRCLIIHSGNSALAKAGTGDVLTGMIAGFMAQGLETLQASATAAYVHGRLADDWVRSGQDKASLLASDLKAQIPEVLSRLRLSKGLS